MVELFCDSRLCCHGNGKHYERGQVLCDEGTWVLLWECSHKHRTYEGALNCAWKQLQLFERQRAAAGQGNDSGHELRGEE